MLKPQNFNKFLNEQNSIKMENMTLNISEVPFKQALMYILASFPIFEKESDSSCWCRELEAVRQLCSTNFSKGVSFSSENQVQVNIHRMSFLSYDLCKPFRARSKKT